MVKITNENIDEIFDAIPGAKYSNMLGYKIWIDQDERMRRRVNAFSPKIGHSYCTVPTGKWNYDGFLQLGIVTSNRFTDKVCLNVNMEDCGYQGTWVLLDTSKFVEMFGFEPRLARPFELKSFIDVQNGASDIRYLGRRDYDSKSTIKGFIRVRK
ncbi:hypothetical protein SP15_108 [Bacillus phage SP-15]|uniref:Uncharacterized protein n=1 Tax=Bacillus phage SP-15 TaxID=1792032 RepID=A0A127AWE8_9CAUD|nr:hypothetical protein SP15_108 [Bacillus phage SP-15]AMM44907.1 hypothetical protein SP15_108 [Bacillus phage SP-15]